MPVIVEIGANTGSDTERFVNESENQVYAFEPDPILFEKLTTKFLTKTNLKLFDFAVDIENGKKNFYSSNLETGIASLHKLNNELKNNIDLQKYPCFAEGFHNTFEVNTIRMDTWIEENKIEFIDFLWMDAQGNDFNILKSFGDKIKILKSGRCECVNQIAIYENIDNYFGDVAAFLIKQGFSVKADYWHQHDTEVDLYFWR